MSWFGNVTDHLAEPVMQEPPNLHIDPNVLRQFWAPESDFQRDMYFAPGYRDWRRDFTSRFGVPPNLDDPTYNTRLAWQAGVVPQPYAGDANHYHWPSAVQMTPPFSIATPLKSEEHQTRWMQDFMQRYGTDPNEASQDQLVDAVRTGIVPLR